MKIEYILVITTFVSIFIYGRTVDAIYAKFIFDIKTLSGIHITSNATYLETIKDPFRFSSIDDELPNVKELKIKFKISMFQRSSYIVAIIFVSLMVPNSVSESYVLYFPTSSLRPYLYLLLIASSVIGWRVFLISLLNHQAKLRLSSLSVRRFIFASILLTILYVLS